MRIVIDTNVAISANGRDTHACGKCQIECIEYIEAATSPKSKKIIVLDDQDLIIGEYKKHLNHRGQPGMGDAFYKYLHDHMYGGDKILLVRINENGDDDTGFDELPENSIDPSDRKLLAAAKVAAADIINALDTDWHEKRDFLSAFSVNVVQLCPEHGTKE